MTITEDDALDEEDETFTVTLSNASNATIADDEATGTILDDDEPPVLSLTPASAERRIRGQHGVHSESERGECEDRDGGYATANGTAEQERTTRASLEVC